MTDNRPSTLKYLPTSLLANHIYFPHLIAFAVMSVSSPIWTSPNGTAYTFAGHNANCTVSVCPVDLSVYGYRPSLPFTSALIGLYAIAVVIQLALGLRYKSWGFMSAMILGCLDEILGYVGRIILYQNPWNHSGFIMQIGTCLKSAGHDSEIATTYLTAHSVDHHWSCILQRSNIRSPISNVSPPTRPSHLSPTSLHFQSP